jgi:hypothetical protein
LVPRLDGLRFPAWATKNAGNLPPAPPKWPEGPGIESARCFVDGCVAVATSKKRNPNAARPAFGTNFLNHCQETIFGKLAESSVEIAVSRFCESCRPFEATIRGGRGIVGGLSTGPRRIKNKFAIPVSAC